MPSLRSRRCSAPGCLAVAFPSPFPKGHRVFAQHPLPAAATHFPLLVPLPLIQFSFCRRATAALFSPEMSCTNREHKSNKRQSCSVYEGERSMGFNERTGSWCSHCNLLVKQWILLSRLTKALFFPPLTVFFKWRIQWRGLSCSYQQAMKWGTSASFFNSFVCPLRVLNRSLKVHTGKKNHTGKKTKKNPTSKR